VHGLITDVFRSVGLFVSVMTKFRDYSIPDSHLRFCQLPTPSMHSV